MMLCYLAEGILQVGQRAGLGSGKFPRLGPIKVVDVILNNYFLGNHLLGPLSWKKVENVNFPNLAKICQHPRGLWPLLSYLDVVIGAGHLRMVLNVKNVLKLQADHETLL